MDVADPSGKFGLADVGTGIAMSAVLNTALSWEPGQGLDTLATNFIIGAAEGIAFGGVVGIGAKFVKLGRFATFAKGLSDIPILKRVGLSGRLLPGSKILSEEMTFKVGSDTILLKSNAIGGGAAKHLLEMLRTKGQMTLSEVLLLEEAEAAVHTAVKQGLVDTAFTNSISKAYLDPSRAKLLSVVVETGNYTWEIAAEIVVENGRRFVKIFHMQPL